jgi:DNA-binding beta-propeller fold protein YncE
VVIAMMKRSLMLLLLICAAVVAAAQTDLVQVVQHSPALPLQASALNVQPPNEGWQLGMVSWIAVDRHGLIYLLQRGGKADPVIVLDREGHVLRSWGRGMYTMPHAIRIDPKGNVWTTDAATSMVYQFSPAGKKLMEIHVGGLPSSCRDISGTFSGFCGTTDIAFAPNGHVFIADGYSNARVLEYTPEGKKVREWGAAGRGPGQFRLVHSIQIDASGVIYVADRENGRVERFDLNGKYLGEWDNLGRIFSLKLDGDSIWLATQSLDLPPLGPGWLLKLDHKTGNLLGHVDVTGAHGIDVLSDGELFLGPGPNQASPQWLRPLATH